MSKISIGVIGCGYWGPNLIRNFSNCPLTEVVAVCDANPARLEAIGRNYRNVKLLSSVDQLLDEKVDAVAIATPVSTHYPLAKRCLEAGRHVLVEKPLAATAREAQSLVEIAERHGRILMVDHTYLFSNAIQKIKTIVQEGALGDLYYVDSVRINLGLFQHDVNVIWDLAPHDLSIVSHVLGLEARSIAAWGCSHANPDIEDIAYVNVDFGDRLLANFHVNWLSPVKLRQMIFAGSKKSLIYNEMNTTEPIKVYDKGIELGASAEERQRLLVNYRSGDVWSPHVEPGEPLQAMARHFAECIQENKPPLSDGHLGLQVVRLLESATRSIRAQGGGSFCPTEFTTMVPTAMAPQATVPQAMVPPSRETVKPDGFLRIAPDVELGKNVKIHCFVNLYGCSIGDDSRVGAFVEIQKGVAIGARCKVSSHTFICEGVTIEDDVFVGHGVVFINDLDPRATADGRPQTEEDWKVIPTRICRGASIGSGAIILAGVTIGAGALVGAGAVVTSDVAAGAVVAGVPARFLRMRTSGGEEA